MLKYFPALLLAGFVLEIASIIWVGGLLGVLPTLLLLIAGGVAGISVFKSAGVNAAAVLKSSIQDPRTQRDLAGATLARVIAGVLFIIPGFFSDLVALLLLLPAVQNWIASKFKVTGGFEASGYRHGWRQDGTVIEGEAIEIEGEITTKEDGGNRRSRL